ncbi:MAG: DUF4835 family protein [Bacteroidales bacterium]|nr:DUF4835 family protein [Bacteroidales bacterium]MBD5241807.1 DUF4835 family protein [Barnesiella sp.]MBD5256925.1 DUF4835 family protein [Bacteroides sp.]
MKPFVCIVVVFLSSFVTQFIKASELNCNVEINAAKVTNASPETFNALKEAIAEYMNTTSFTDAQYSTIEKIDCKLYLTVNDYTDNTVTGTLQVQSSRPVYGSSYTSTLINLVDNDISFSYTPGDRIIHTSSSVESNLAAILDFFAYLIIAVDSDSFAPKGGDRMYEAAAEIVQLARNTGEKGWRAIDDSRNRASLLSAITEGNSSAIRNIYYDYHRKGLDIMSVSPDKGRAAITESLKALQSVASAAPMSPVITLFRDTKLDELSNIYSKGPADERKSVYNMLIEIYPTEAKRIESIKE